MHDPYESSEPDHKAFLGEDDMPDFNPLQDDLPPELSFLSGGELSASEDPKDQFITGTAKGEMRTTADLARFLPPEDLATLNSISHPVKEGFLDPYLNTNLASRNLELIYRQWQEQEPNADLRKLAFVIAASAMSTQSTLQCLAPALTKEDWEQEHIQAGFWKRGFTALEGRDDYQQMSKEMGLDLIQFPSLVNVPAISALILGIGMFQTGFTSGKTLGDYFKRGEENWEGASEILGKKDGGDMGRLAQEIMADIQKFLWSEEKKGGMEMTDFLIQKGTSNAFAKVRLADSIRMLKALRYLPFDIPESEDEDEVKTIEYRYGREKGSLGTIEEIRELPIGVLQKFQTDTNQKFPLPSPLPETGELNTGTFQVLISGGHQFLSGTPIIAHGFDQKILPINPIVKAFRDNREGNLGLVQLGRLLLQYLPLDQSDQILAYVDQLPPMEAQRLSYEMTRQASAHQLAMIAPEILTVVKQNLLISGKADWQPQIDRIQEILT